MSLYYDGGDVRLFHGDAEAVAQTLPDGLARTIVTSPPYFGLRDYGEDGQIGSEDSIEDYIGRLVGLFHELRRVLADDGTLWVNLGDSYTSGNRGWRAPDKKNRARAMSLRPPTPEGLKDKDLIGVPWRVAFALQADDWVLRSDIIWHKPNPMPESVTDRPTKSHEYLFLLAKSPSYYYDAASIAEPDKGADHPRGRNKRSVWTVPTTPFPESHFAVYPPELIRPCILAGSQPGDVVLDPFSGSGTTGQVATFEGRKYVGIDLNREYLDLSLRTRFQQPTLPWEVSA